MGYTKSKHNDNLLYLTLLFNSFNHLENKRKKNE